MNHTPTPWKVVVEKNEGTGDPLDKTILVTDMGGALIADINENELDASGIDNAAFIIRACNAHDELLDLVREELKQYEMLAMTNRPMQPSEKKWMERAKQAIAKAEVK